MHPTAIDLGMWIRRRSHKCLRHFINFLVLSWFVLWLHLLMSSKCHRPIPASNTIIKGETAFQRGLWSPPCTPIWTSMSQWYWTSAFYLRFWYSTKFLPGAPFKGSFIECYCVLCTGWLTGNAKENMRGENKTDFQLFWRLIPMFNLSYVSG